MRLFLPCAAAVLAALFASPAMAKDDEELRSAARAILDTERRLAVESDAKERRALERRLDLLEDGARSLAREELRLDRDREDRLDRLDRRDVRVFDGRLVTSPDRKSGVRDRDDRRSSDRDGHERRGGDRHDGHDSDDDDDEEEEEDDDEDEEDEDESDEDGEDEDEEGEDDDDGSGDDDGFDFDDTLRDDDDDG